VTVNNSAPTVVASGGGVYEVGTDITLSAELADYDGDVLDYEWREGDIVLMAGSIETAIGGYPVTLPDYVVSGLEIGIHQLTLEVEDGATTPVLASATVEITDTTVPVLAPSATPSILWPPNHKFRDITIQANAADNSGGTITLEAYVSSSEEPDTDGDGNTIPDYTDPQIDQNTGEITLQLRAERSGKGDGRIYTVVITATDESANSSTASVNIVAPHNKSK
jgi:hypothetical protein